MTQLKADIWVFCYPHYFIILLLFHGETRLYIFLELVMCVFMLMSIHLVLSCLDYIAMQYSCHSMCSCSLCALGYLKLVQNYLICFSCKLFDLTLCYLCNMLRNRELIFLGFGWTAVLWTLSSVSCSRLQRFYKRATCKRSTAIVTLRFVIYWHVCMFTCLHVCLNMALILNMALVHLSCKHQWR